MAKHGKKYEAALAKVDEDKQYTPLEACTLAKEIAPASFDESIEVAFRLNIDTRQADQQVRGSISLPNGTGKEVRVAVFAEGDKAKEALEAGADVVGSDDLVADVQAGNINFDAAVATPDMMSKVGRLGKVLGPRGMMPNRQGRERAQGWQGRVPCRSLWHLPCQHWQGIFRAQGSCRELRCTL